MNKSHSKLVQWILFATTQMLVARFNEQQSRQPRRTRSRIRGPVNPAGTKLARMAAEHRLTLR